MHKGVYAITGWGRDIYTAMTRVCAAWLRTSNPEMLIIVGCDSNHCAGVRWQQLVLTPVKRWTIDKLSGKSFSCIVLENFRCAGVRKMIDLFVARK